MCLVVVGIIQMVDCSADVDLNGAIVGWMFTPFFPKAVHVNSLTNVLPEPW